MSRKPIRTRGKITWRRGRPSQEYPTLEEKPAEHIPKGFTSTIEMKTATNGTKPEDSSGHVRNRDEPR